MHKKKLDTRFEEAIEIANLMSQHELPQDIQLRLYAYFKQATSESVSPNFIPGFDLRSAFKMNALMQINHLSQEEAKELYIDLIIQLKNENYE